MTYREQLVACLKTNGRILREYDNGTVMLPFGSEYSVLVKNLDSVRIQVKVSIDGIDATENTRLIVAPNSNLELERFIRNGNLSAGNRFKFIERTLDIENHRGVGVDDGIVRIEAWREHVQQFINVPIPRYYDDWRPRSWRSHYRYYGTKSNSLNRNLVGGSATRSNAPSASLTVDYSNTVSSNNVSITPTCDAGITVPGSESRQQFHHAADFPTEPQSRVITLRLVGQIGVQAVTVPLTVDVKPQCSTCGKVNPAFGKFCSNCGTALVLV